MATNGALALIADARNADELAFVLGHEAAHHIAGHIPRAGQQARVGALAGILAAQAIGADQGTAEQLGQVMGAVGDRHGMSVAFIVPLVCFAVVMAYGFAWKRLSRAEA